MPLNYSSSKKKKSTTGSTSSKSSVKNSGLTNLGRMIAENDPQAIWSVQRRTERQDRLDDVQRRFNEYLARDAWNNRLATLDGPIAGPREEKAYWQSKLKSSENSMRSAQSRLGYNDNAVFDPTAKRDYESAKRSRDLAKRNYTTLAAQDELLNSGAYDKQAQKNKFIQGAKDMSYENLLATINSGYLTGEQRQWGEDILREKANSTQAKSRSDYYNAEADKLEAELAERYATGYDGTPEGGYLYGQSLKMVDNLRNMAKQYSERGWMAERLELGDNAKNSPTYAQDYMMVPNRAYNREYQALFGLVSDDDLSTKDEISAARRREVMTNEEKYNYSAIYNTQGAEKAHDYLDALGYELDQRLQTQKTEAVNARLDTIRNAENAIPDTGIKWLDDYIEKSAKQNMEAGWFLEARANNVASGMGALDALWQGVTSGGVRPVNWNTESFTPHTVSQAIQENQLNQIDSSVGRFAYQTAGSMVDSLVVMGATVLGVPGATAILGGAAATDSMLKAKERGATDSQALSVGLLSGVAEALFEQVSLEKLLTAGTPATLKEVIKNMLFRQGVTEASEEVFTTIANTISDAILMGDKSELRTKIRQYVEQGYSQSDAEKLGAIDWFKDLGMDALGGFVSGAIFGGFEQGASYGGFRSDMANLQNSRTAGAAVDNYSAAMQRVLDENGEVRKDSENAAKRLQETYQRTMEGLSDRSTQYEEIAHNIDQQVEQGQMTPEDATVAKAFVEFTMGEQAYNQKTQEQRAKQAEELDQKARSMVQNMAEKSTATISSTQSIVDNYDSSIANPSDYFGAFRYYEEMGQQARATGNDNFAEVWKNDERYAGKISQQAAMTAFAAGRTTAAPASKIMQVTQRGTGELKYSDEAMKQLANNVKSVNDAVELLSAFAKKTGFTVNLDESLADGENAKFIANAMTIAINPRANVIAGLFHESGHAVQRFNPQAYAQLKSDMISWYAQTQGMTNMDQMLKQYGKAYKGYSRDALEVEMVNDAFGALFNREDSARDIANWLVANKTEAEQKSFVEKLTDLIDRIVNWVKSLVSADGVSQMQKRTVDMQAKTAQAFRQAFLDALDKASETAQTTSEYFADDGSGHDYSMKSFADGLGFDLDEDLNLVNKDGSRVTHVTGDMIRDSKLGAMISYAREHGRISSKDMQTELNMLADILNMALEKGDNNLMMYWEVAGSMVFSALKDNSDKQYGLTVDMSTICAKTKAIVDAMSETMLRLGRGLTREEVEVVYYTTGKNGEPTPCPVCYVFSRWFGIGGLLDDISTFQKEYGKQSTKKDMEFAKRILGEIIEFKDNSSKTKQKDYWSARDNAWKYGRIASDMKSKYNSWISSAEKAIANSDTIRATIAELQAQQALVDEKAAKKLQTQINKEMKKKALLTDEQRQQKFDDIDGYKKSIHEVEAWQWLIKTKLSMDKDGNFTKTEGWKPVPPEILFDLNRGAEFASQYPLTWAYRTGKGSAMGKAMMPYSDVRVGEIAQGVAKGSVKEIKMGIDPDDEIKFNPFNADDAASVKKQLEILKSAVKKTRRQNLIGGMRFQSTSDFRYEYGSDYLMAFLELQALGSNVQLYTKVIEAVDFLASMNADINLSAMPLGDGWYEDENGRHLQSSSVTGINFEAAVEMSRKYDNVQIIMVGINRNHILTCLEGDEVTFVIPFHGSGQNVAQIAYLMDMLRENLDVLRAQDYTNYQSDHDMLKDSRKLTDEEKKRGVNTWGLTIEEQARVKAMRQLRMDILTGKLSSGLSDEQRALLKQSKFLGDLYNRFYVDENSREFGVTLEKDVAEQVFPYEYWDKTGNYDNADINGQRFVEYCAEIGYAPRFSGYNSKGQYNPEFDFYSNGQQKGYWKLLIDRPMYANRYDEQGNWVGYGDYREQKAINASKFKMETIDPTWQTATYGNVMGAKNHSAKTEKIAEESIGYLKQGLRYDTATKTLVPKGQEVRPTKEGAESEEEEDADYSRTVEDMDEEYMAAVESGDEYAQYRLVKEAAMAAGAITEGGDVVDLYHGTPRDFGYTTFDLGKTKDKRTIFLTDDVEVAATYSGVAGVRRLLDERKIDINSLSLEDAVNLFSEVGHEGAFEVATPEAINELLDEIKYANKDTYEKYKAAHDDSKLLEEAVSYYSESEQPHATAVAKRWLASFLSVYDATSEEEIKNAISELTAAQNEFYDYTSTMAGAHMEEVLGKATRHGDITFGMTDAHLIQDVMSGFSQPGVINEIGEFVPEAVFRKMLAHQVEGESKKGNYGVFAFAKNILVVPAYGENWDSITWLPKEVVEMREKSSALAKAKWDIVNNAMESGGPVANEEFYALRDERARVDLQLQKALDELWDKYRMQSNGSRTRAIAAWAKDHGYDGVRFEYIYDNGPFNRRRYETVGSNVYVVFNPNQVKSSDPITYDADGNVIPLSERFNLNKDDIRWSRTVDDWLQDLSIDDIIEDRASAPKKAERRIDEVNKRLKAIGLQFNGTSVAAWTDEKINKYLGGDYYGSSNPNYAQAHIAYMTPQQYLNLTMGSNTATVDRIQKESSEYGPVDFNRLGDSDPIRLYIDKGKNGARVVGHEGRHRMMLLGQAGFSKVPVLLFDSSDKYGKATLTNYTLRPQKFYDTGFISKGRNVVVDEAIPFSQGNRELIIQKFGSGNTEADVSYSLSVEDFEEYKDQIGDARGININDSTQAFTEEILNGEKTIETRTSPTLRNLVGQRVGIVRTGTRGGARLVGMANISEEVTYDSKEAFDADYDKHRVGKDSEYYWNGKTKYGYVLTDVQPITDASGARAELPVDATGNAISTRTLAPTTDYSRGTGTSLTDTERRTLEKRVREAERNAAKEKQRAEHFKSEMRLTPKFTPDATQISELATEISTMFGGTDVDTAGVEKSLRDIFWNINEANSSGKEARAYAALDLAQQVAETVVNASVSGDMTTTLEGKMMKNEVVAMGANAIMDRILQTRMAKSTAADKWNSKLQETRKALGQTETYAAKEAKRADRLESELSAYKQKMADQIAFLKAKADADHAFNRQAYEQRIARVRAQRDIALREQKEYYKGRIGELSEQKRVAKIMPKVKKEVDALRKMLLSPDEKTYKYVPDIVKSAVSDFLSCVDFVTRTMAETGEALKSDAREVTKLDAIRKLAEQAKDMQNSDVDADYFLDLPSDTVEVIDLLRDRVTSLVGVLQEAQSAGLIDSEIHVRTADSTTLEIIRKLARTINHAVTNINKNYVQGRFAHVDDGARATVQFLDGVKRSEHYHRSLGNSLLWSMSTPYYAFHRFGDGGQAIFENLGAGLAQFGKNIKTILNYVDETFTRDEQRKWSNQTVTVNVTNAQGEAQTLTMTATQLMSLYCLSRREAAQVHLYTGGITLQETKAGKTTIAQAQAVHVTPESLLEAFGQLSDRQKEVAQKLQEFMSTTGSDWGNEVSMKRWGVKAFEEKFYFPMKTSGNGRATMKANDDDASSLYGMVNQGFTKHLQTNANNALVIDDVFSVFTDHSANMAKYNAMVLPLLDAMKWYNWTQRADVTTAEGDLHRNDISVKGAIEDAFGTGANKYFRQFIADLNSSKAEGGAGFDIGSRLMSHYKAAAVGMNLRVALLQPTAFFRAAMVLSPADLARGAAMKGGQEEMLKYSGIAQWKDLGFYDTDIGRSVRRQIQGERTKWGQFKNKAVDISMKAAEYGDKITWAALWNACKIEQQRQNKGVSYEKLMELTERRFNEVIFATQVFDSTLSRSEVMRSQNGLKKIMTAFLSEPTLSYNMVLDKFFQYSMDVQKLGKGAAWKKHGHNITRALAVYSVTNLVAALAESFADAWRDDDDDPFLKKMMDKMFGDWSEVDDPFKAVKQYYTANLMNDMSVLGKIPILKEIVSLAQGFDIGGRMDVQALQSIKNVLGIWYEKYNLMTGRLDKATKDTWYGNMTTYGAISKTLQAASQVSGIPVYNGLRDVIGIYNSTLGKLTGKVLAYQTKYDEVDKSLDGGTAGINKAISDAVKKGTAEKDVLKHIKATIKDRYTGAEGEAMSRGKAKQLLMDTVGLKEKAAEDLLDEWTMAKDTGISYDKMKESFMEGDITEKQAIDYRVKYGHVAQDKAEATVAGWKAEKDTGYAKDEIADDYNAGNISRAEAIKLYEAFGASNEDATHNVDLLDFKEDHPGAEEFVYTQMVNYQQTCEKHKVPVDVFYDVVTLKGQTHADVDANGNAINGSARKKVLDYINKQPVSTIQKDALYRACGYAESTLKEAPWH